MAFLDETLKPYNPKAYVPGGSTKKVARSIVAKGKVTPVPKKKNPYVKPKAGGGSQPGSPSSPNLTAQEMGITAQTARTQAPVSTQLDVNYESDPVLARIRALGTQNVGNAETEAAALRKQAILDTGLTDVGREIGVDQGTLDAAAANPNSVAAQLAHENMLRGQQLDESLNNQNLFYSGHRANQLGELAGSYQSEQANLVKDLRSALGEIDSGVLQAKQASALDEQSAIEEAAARAASEAQAAEWNQTLQMALNPNYAYENDPNYFVNSYPDPNYPVDFPPVMTPEEELAMLLSAGGSGNRWNVAM